MVIREEKKFLANKIDYLTGEKKMTPQEKQDYRRKKLVEVRKGTGAGRPIQRRKPSSIGYTPIASINEKREKEYQRVLQAAADQKEGAKRQRKILKKIVKSQTAFDEKLKEIKHNQDSNDEDIFGR